MARREEGEVGRRIVFSYPLLARTDMPINMRNDCQEICSNVMEKHSDNEMVKQKQRLGKPFGQEIVSLYFSVPRLLRRRWKISTGVSAIGRHVSANIFEQ